MRRVVITVERIGSGDLSWDVLVDDKVVMKGLTHTQALRERMSLWWSQPAQRASARERITGG